MCMQIGPSSIINSIVAQDTFTSFRQKESQVTSHLQKHVDFFAI